MGNQTVPGSSADVNVQVRALAESQNVSSQFKTVILKKNIVNNVNTLVQSMMTLTNTKYVVKYDFTLGENITVPVGCIIEFDGGSIIGATNCTLTGQSTKLINLYDYTILNNVTQSGTFVTIKGVTT